MTRSLRFLAPLLTPLLTALAGCTAISGFNDLEKSGCATPTCESNPDTSVAEAAIDSSPADGARADSAVDSSVVVEDTDAPDTEQVDSGASETLLDSGPDTLPDTTMPDTMRPDVAGLPCPTGKGAPMVRVVTTTPAGSTYTFCIDKTETTNAHYEAFLAAEPLLTLQPAICGTVNTTFTPTGGLPAGLPNQPVVNVDWCDAYAYCAWAGKRLCGRLGGGANPITEQANPNSGEWMNACTSGDVTTHKYPYGPSYDSTKCNGAPSSGLVDVGSKSGCEGAAPGVFDMSGNAYEWENSCGELAGDNCFIRGGSFQTVSAETLACAGRAVRARNSAAPNTGIRCCAD